MARPIDEKIVKMTLDNAKFKQNVRDTLSSFQTINDEIGSSKGMDLSRIADGISAIERRFSVLGVVAATVISKITSKAMEMGKGLYSALIDPLVEGGKKRALNIEQAKFQFEGLGMDVEKTMKSANDAVLGTAFGLDEAAVVASQFGATGMRAGKEMTESLRGISGVAAMTGSSYSDIGNIFTTVAGNGRLMGNDLLRLGSRGVNAAATLGKAFDKTEAEIREMVTKGQISFEDFSKAMSDAFGEHATKANETYTGSLSNLRSALSRIGAAVYTPRFENMRDIFNALTPKVDDLAKALEPLIDGFNELSAATTKNLISAIEKIDFKKFEELGGIKNLVESFWNVIGFGKNIMNSASEGFKRIFPNSFMTTLVSITEGIKNLTSNLNMSTETAGKITTIFQGVFSIFSTVYIIAKKLAEAIFGIIPEGTGDGVLDFAVLLSEMAIAFNDSIKEGNVLTETIGGIGKVLGAIGSAVKEPLGAIINFSKSIVDHLGTAMDWIKKVLGPVGEWIKEAFSGFGGEELLGGGFLVTVMILIRKLSSFFDNARNSLDSITGTVSGIFSELGGALKSFQEQVKYNNLMKIAIAIGLLALSLKLLEGMSVADIAKGIGALTGSMAVLSVGMMAIEKMNFTGGIRASVTIIALATTITIMASALKKISDLDIKELGVGMAGLAGVVILLTGTIVAMSKMGGKIQAGSLQLIALATSVLILSSALETLAGIKASSLAKSVGALGIIFAEIAIFLKVVNGSKIGPGTAIGIIGVSAAIKIIVSAIGDIAKIDVGGLTKGLVTIGLILAEIALFSKIAGGPQMMIAGVGILMIATALSTLMIPVTLFSKMSWEELAKGLGGMAVALLAVAAAGAAASSSIIGAAGILVMAVALNALMPPILIFSKMSWGSMLKGFAGLAIGMGVLAGASLLLTPAVPSMLAFGAGLLVLGAAIALAGAGIALFGAGLTALATLTATSVAAIISALGLLIKGLGSLIVDVVDFLVELGSAMIDGVAELGPKFIKAGVEIISLFIDSMIEYLSDMYPRAAEAFIVTINKILRIIGDNSQEFIESGYDIVINLMKGIQEKAPELQNTAIETVVVLLEGMADAIAENRTPMIEAMVRLMGEVILVVVEAGVEMIDALFGWIPGVEAATAEIGETAEQYIRDHFGAGDIGIDKGVEFADGLGSTSEDTGDAVDLLANTAIGRVQKYSLVDAGSDLGEELGVGLESQLGRVYDTGQLLATNGESGVNSQDYTDSGADLGDQLGIGIGSRSDMIFNTGSSLAGDGELGTRSVDFTESGRSLGDQLGIGIDSKTGLAYDKGKMLAKEGDEGAKSVTMTPTGKNFGLGFSRGIGRSTGTVVDAAKSMAISASNAVKKWLSIASPSKLLDLYGNMFGDGFAGGISDRIRKVMGKSREMAIKATQALKDSLEPIQPEEDEIKFRIVIDDDDFDWDKLEAPDTDFIAPDRSLTKSLASMMDDEYRQNRNILNSDKREILEALKSNPEPDEEVLALLQNISDGVENGHVIIMDSREVARTTEPHIRNIQERNSIIEKRTRGVT